MLIQSTKGWLAVALSLGTGGARGISQPQVEFTDLSFTTFGNRDDGLPIFVLPPDSFGEQEAFPRTFQWESNNKSLRIEQVKLYVEGNSDPIGKGEVPGQENENGGGTGVNPSIGAAIPGAATSPGVPRPTAVENPSTVEIPSPNPSSNAGSEFPVRRALRQNIIPLTVSVNQAGTGGSVTINDVRQLSNYSAKRLYFGAVWPGNTGESFSRGFAVAKGQVEYEILKGTGIYQDTSPADTEVNGTAANPTLGQGPTTSFAPTMAPNPTGQGIAPNEGGLATGAIIGIAVACGVFGLLLIGVGIWFLIRRRNRQAANNHLGSPGQPYGIDRARTEDLIAEKEASAGGADPSPHSPYSDDGVVLVPAGTGDSGPYHHEGSPIVPAGAVAAPVLSHHHQTRSYTPYSDHGSGVGANGSPSIHAASIVHSTHEETSRAGMGSPTIGRATPHSSLSPRYAHLVEEGMTEDEIRRLEDEERQLDAAIEQARGTR
ncbi:hypothetical protein V8F33_007329 [Rhypophila sp. PSN 637]